MHFIFYAKKIKSFRKRVTLWGEVFVLWATIRFHVFNEHTALLWEVHHSQTVIL